MSKFRIAKPAEMETGKDCFPFYVLQTVGIELITKGQGRSRSSQRSGQRSVKVAVVQGCIQNKNLQM